jgi:hypothetical protein
MAVLMTMAKRNRKRNRSGGRGNGSGSGKGGDGSGNFGGKPISATVTTFSAATAWTLVNVRPCWPLVGRSILG